MCEFNNHLYVGVNAILSVDESDITDNSATLICELPCFSPNLRCVVSHFTTNNMDVNVASTTGHVNDSVMVYSYPTQTITLNCLNSGTIYNYCIIAASTTNMAQVGEAVCGSFTTQKIISENNGGM